MNAKNLLAAYEAASKIADNDQTLSLIRRLLAKRGVFVA